MSLMGLLASNLAQNVNNSFLKHVFSLNVDSDKDFFHLVASPNRRTKPDLFLVFLDKSPQINLLIFNGELTESEEFSVSRLFCDGYGNDLCLFLSKTSC